jgi:hypothetical protein
MTETLRVVWPNGLAHATSYPFWAQVLQVGSGGTGELFFDAELGWMGQLNHFEYNLKAISSIKSGKMIVILSPVRVTIAELTMSVPVLVL